VSRRLLASYLALTVVVLAALEIPLAIVNARNERQDLTAKLERDGFVLASLVDESLAAGTRASGPVRRVASAYGARTGARVVITDRRGYAVADSNPTETGELDFATRPEIARALGGATVSGTRPSHTLGTDLLYVAVPVASAGHVLGVVRLTYPMSEVDRRLRRYRFALVGVAVSVLAAAAAIGVLLARWITRPLARVEAAAARVGEGDLAARAPEDDGPPEVRRLARELNETTVKLEALLRSQDQFVADASHELRTPLTALRLRLENLDPVPEEALAEAERLARLVDELLALARADAAAGPAADVDLHEIVRRRVEAWEPLADERGVRLSVDGRSTVVRAGEGRVEQILDNLLSNALDAAPAGSTIRVAAADAEMHVVDEGPGLTAEERARAFDRFWRASSGPGSGLGLAIARRLTEADEGEIELRPVPGGGIDALVRYRGTSPPRRTASVR
jgi:signal transduction histidine kinase